MTEPLDVAGPNDARQVFTEAAQQAAGVIAARHRGDLAGAGALMAGFPSEQARTMGFFLVAELTMTMLAQNSGQSLDDVARDLSLDIAGTFLSR